MSDAKQEAWENWLQGRIKELLGPASDRDWSEWVTRVAFYAGFDAATARLEALLERRTKMLRAWAEESKTRFHAAGYTKGTRHLRIDWPNWREMWSSFEALADSEPEVKA